MTQQAQSWWPGNRPHAKLSMKNLPSAQLQQKKQMEALLWQKNLQAGWQKKENDGIDQNRLKNGKTKLVSQNDTNKR
jgi:hypothetical protein